MKLLTFRLSPSRRARFGALLSNGHVLDITGLDRRDLPPTLLRCIQGGEAALATVRTAVDDAEASLKAGRTSGHVHPMEAARIQLPYVPGKIVALGRNYGEHVAETGSAAPGIPNAFMKLTNSLIAHGEAIRKPAWTRKLDYENELVTVIGRDCVNVAEDRWEDVVFGYTIMNDVSARDVQLQERSDGNILVGKNFPAAAPLGPWIVTKDEVLDPHALRLVTRVNGEVRQDASTASQIHRIPRQVSWYSRLGFQAGDMISSGTPAGVAMGYHGPGSWYLKHGDVVECELVGVGVLRNPVRRAL